MTIDSNKISGMSVDGIRQTYTSRDARLYALSIGFGTDPLNELELDFVSERETFKTVPTMATIFADVILQLTLACKLKHPELALHGEQKLELYSALPEAADLDICGSVSELYDRGAEKGAEIHMVAEGTLQGEDEPLYRATYVTIARGDGGFGGSAPIRSNTANRIPERSSDTVWEFRTARNQALLYSLNGDPNPIHTQPAIAKRAGFDVPIMHGLGTYGMACRAILATYCVGDPSSIRSFDVRFSSPVLPGEMLAVEMWRLEEGVAFQARAVERDTLVLKNGFCRMS